MQRQNMVIVKGRVQQARYKPPTLDYNDVIKYMQKKVCMGQIEPYTSIYG